MSAKRIMQWIVSPRYAAYPESYANGSPKQARLLKLMLDHGLEIEEKADADFENFTEDAYRLDAALKGFGAENVWITGATPTSTLLKTSEMMNANSGEIWDCPFDQQMAGYGFDYYGLQRSTWTHMGSPLLQERIADQYMHSYTFQKFSGRNMELAGYYSKRNDIFTVIKKMYDTGTRKFFIKLCQAKAGIFRYEFSEKDETNGILTIETIRNIMDLEISDYVMHLMGNSNVFLVQEDVEMMYEYRIFMVEGVPVTGAGCIPEYTPLDNLGDDFDPSLRKHRSQSNPIEPLPAFVDVYRTFAEQVSHEFADEIPQLRNYVLDVALIPDKDLGFTPIIVELNGSLNSGLYATRPVAVTTAMAKAYADGKRDHYGRPI